MPDFSAQLSVATAAAKHVGAWLRARFSEVHHIDAEFAHDLKLSIDKEAQQMITDVLRSRFPDYGIFGEEGTESAAADAPVWIIDPLDGTVNYFYGIPLFCVSIALRVGQQVVLGCVYDPMRDECFSVIQGKTPTLNNAPIRVSSRREMRQAVIFIGHGTHDGSGDAGIRRFAHLSAQVRKIRILGSAALALCYIAAGRMDAYIENRIHLWDFAAAAAILEAAGGGFEFTPLQPGAATGAVIAWNGLLPIHAAMEIN